MRTLTIRLLAIIIGSCMVLMMAEGALRLWPRLLPERYLETLPFHGAGLFVPNILERTPIDAVPIPYFSSPVYGKSSRVTVPFPPKLQEMGLVPGGGNPNTPVIGDVTVEIDRQGFGNPAVLNKTDILLMGDSFGFATAIRQPPGLQALLQNETGASVYNLSVPAIGPVRELWLLKNVGLAKHPRAVIWLFFPANDLNDIERLIAHRKSGVTTYAGLVSKPVPQGLYTWNALKAVFSSSTQEAEKQFLPVPGVIMDSNHGPIQMWFYPPYLQNLLLTQQDWKSHPGWGPAQAVILEAQRATAAAGAAFLLVYVPTKPEVYLPFVDQDAEKIFAMAVNGLDDKVELSAIEFLHKALRNRSALEDVVQGFCAKHKIPFLSYTPMLTRQITGGEIGYPPADTHWIPAGQAAGLPEILDWLQHTGIKVAHGPGP